MLIIKSAKKSTLIETVTEMFINFIIKSQNTSSWRLDTSFDQSWEALCLLHVKIGSIQDQKYQKSFFNDTSSKKIIQKFVTEKNCEGFYSKTTVLRRDNVYLTV